MKKIYNIFLRCLLCAGLFILNSLQGILAKEKQSVPAIIAYGSYTINDIQVKGNVLLDKEAIIDTTGFKIGGRLQIPSTSIHDAINKILQQPLISDVAIYLLEVTSSTVVVRVVVKEHTKLSKYVFKGASKEIIKAIDEHINIDQEVVLKPSFIKITKKKIESYLHNKGFADALVVIKKTNDIDKVGYSKLKISINQGKKITVNNIFIQGNNHIATGTLKNKIKSLRERPHFTLIKDIAKNIISFRPLRKNGLLRKLPNLDEMADYVDTHTILLTSKFVRNKLHKMKKEVIDFYQSQGFRDAKIAAVKIYRSQSGFVDIGLTIEEGSKYIIKSIKFVGNRIYSAAQLSTILNMYVGDVYDPLLLNKRLLPTSNREEKTIYNLYANNGYLNFQVTPVEVGMDGNGIAIEIRLYEGAQFTINKVLVTGNTITHESVIRRALTTLPGNQYRYVDLVASLHSLAMLDLFKKEKLHPIITPDNTTNRVNITYNVVEKVNFTLNLQGGYAGVETGATLGLELGTNNFSWRNFCKFTKPLGDGQNCHIGIKFGNKSYRNLTFSFMEPWLGGKEAYIFSASLNHSLQYATPASRTSQERVIEGAMWPFYRYKKNVSNIRTTGGKVRLGKRIRWPSKYWKIFFGVDYTHNKYTNYKILDDAITRSGVMHDLSLDCALERDSTNHPIYPTRGWTCNLQANITPPYSLLASHNGQTGIQEKYKWKEYHKWMIDTSWYQSIIGDFVGHLRGHFGIVGNFSSKNKGPFERFFLGGSNHPAEIMGNLLGGEHISLRGYDDNTVTPKKGNIKGGIIYNKLVGELRYPIINSPACCLYILVFAEAGGNWLSYTDYTPYDMKKSWGAGLRIHLPMLASIMPALSLIGFDWGYRLDTTNSIAPNKDKFSYQFSFCLGGR